MTAPRAWLDHKGGYVYLRVGRQWFEFEFEFELTFGPWPAAEPTHSSVAWMRENALELHPREAARLARDVAKHFRAR